MEACTAQNSCSLHAVCIAKAQSERLSGGCNQGKPLLKAVQAVGSQVTFELNTCHTKDPCHAGFYCSTALQDVGARCCRSDSASPEKPGTCPVPPNEDRPYWCVNGCLSDADCHWSEKCCQNTATNCTLKTCKPAEPCSLVTCPAGHECAVAPDRYTTSCVPSAPPPPSAGAPGSPGSMSQDANPFTLAPQPQPRRWTCPRIQPRAYYWGECFGRYYCGHGYWSCGQGQLCCASLYCGNVCTNPVLV